GRVFVGGHWRDEQEWPLARTSSTPYYLHANGALSTEPPANDSPATYRFDPKDPVPTLGGNLSSRRKERSRSPAPRINGAFWISGCALMRCRSPRDATSWCFRPRPSHVMSR